VNRTAHAGRIAAAIAVATAILVAAPVISIVTIALQPAPDIWQHLINYVLPATLFDTTLLLTGVGALSLAMGAGTAWLISLHDFRGRGILLWLVPLPLAMSTCSSRSAWFTRRWPCGCRCRTRCVCCPICARCPAPSS
jgi:iron(III) transport system permease protein